MDASRQVGEGEAIDNPSAAPNVSSTKVRAAAASAPATAGLQESAGVGDCRRGGPGGPRETLSASVILLDLFASVGLQRSPKKDRIARITTLQADEIDQLVHRSLME